jgi:hypothetical protein
MDVQQWKKLAREQRKWRRDQWLRAIIENFPLFWIFDSQLHEVYRISVRETAQAYRRMKIRYFFSWEGLSKFLLAPVFKIALTSLIVTPFIASAYISVREALGPFFDYPFPKQMGLLFFSGLLVVIARIFYELRCPNLVKAHINSSSLDTHNLQNKQWLQVELEHCFLQYIVCEPITEEYIRGKKILKWHEKMREGHGEEPREEWEKKIREGPEKQTYDSLELSIPISELSEQRVGFDSYGIWLIEELLLRIAKEKKHKVFTGGVNPKNFQECREGHGAEIHPQYSAVYHVIFEVIDGYRTGPEQSAQCDFLLGLHETDHLVFDPFPKGASIHEYFHGIHVITNLGANDVVREFIAENENYWKPFTRMAIAMVLLFSLLCLLGFLVIQTQTVLKAIFS